MHAPCRPPADASSGSAVPPPPVRACAGSAVRLGHPHLQAVADVNWSRVYGGVHFKHAVTEGAALGRRVGEYVAKNEAKLKAPGGPRRL